MRRTILTVSGLIVAGLSTFLTIAARAYDTFATWPVTTVAYYINPENADVSPLAAEAAVQTGASAWETQSAANFRFVYGGRATDTTTGYDSRNVVIFRSASSGGAIATTYYWTSGSRLVDADIIYWDGGWTFFTGTSGCSSGAYIEDVAAHEFGHALGLKHSSASDATMYPSYSRCSTNMRTLAEDDIAGVQALYPPVATNTPPALTISAPSNNSSYMEGTAVSFAASASDSEDGNLSTRLVWTSSRDGQIGSGSSFSRVLSVGTHIVTAAVSDSGGETSTAYVSVAVTAAPNAAPAVSISAPANNTTVTEGTSVTFTGSASDPEDGNLTSRLVWTSSLDGPLGMGGSLSRTLSAGSHVIGATVTDTDGASASAQVSVTVTAVNAPVPPPSELWLSASALKKKGLQFAELRWGGSSSTQVDIYRDGVKVATTSNTGSYTDAINRRGSASYTYKVCETATSKCSNDYLIRF